MRLVSWNIQWGRGADGRVDLARTLRAAREVCDFDVLCLQEVAVNFPGLAGSSGEDEVAFFAAALPGFSAHFGAGVDLCDGRGGRSLMGNLILSRLPVLQVWCHLLPWPADAAVPSMQRVCVEAVVQAARGPLRILTTHLEYYSATQRAAQVDALRALQREACAHGAAPRPAKDGGASDACFAATPRPAEAVLCGDFNFEPDSEDYARLAAPIDAATPAWVDAWPLAHGSAPHAHSVGLHGADWPERPFCCDFVWVSAPLAQRVCDTGIDARTDASDHQPLWLDLDY